MTLYKDLKEGYRVIVKEGDKELHWTLGKKLATGEMNGHPFFEAVC